MFTFAERKERSAKQILRGCFVGTLVFAFTSAQGLTLKLTIKKEYAKPVYLPRRNDAASSGEEQDLPEITYKNTGGAIASTESVSEVASFEVGQLVTIDATHSPKQSFLHNKQGLVIQRRSNSSTSVIAMLIPVNAEKLQQCTKVTHKEKDESVVCSIDETSKGAPLE